jgi:hypothetical protein
MLQELRRIHDQIEDEGACHFAKPAGMSGSLPDLLFDCEFLITVNLEKISGFHLQFHLDSLQLPRIIEKTARRNTN